MTKLKKAIASNTAKSGYVAVMRSLAWGSDRLGFSDWLARRHHRNRGYHWASSLMAIHNIDGLVALDVPWWTYSAIERIDNFLKTRPARVFEYGSGASTIWAAKRAASVISVEHDVGWHALVSERVSAHSELCPVDLRCVESEDVGVLPFFDPIYLSKKSSENGLYFESYASEIENSGGPFDLIVIDGRARPACLKHAVSHLASGGMIVFDNSHRARYREALIESGLSIHRFPGLAPSLPYPEETSILTAPNSTP